MINNTNFVGYCKHMQNHKNNGIKNNISYKYNIFHDTNKWLKQIYDKHPFCLDVLIDLKIKWNEMKW